jgi:BTB/POZ domain
MTFPGHGDIPINTAVTHLLICMWCSMDRVCITVQVMKSPGGLIKGNATAAGRGDAGIGPGGVQGEQGFIQGRIRHGLIGGRQVAGKVLAMVVVIFKTAFRRCNTGDGIHADQGLVPRRWWSVGRSSGHGILRMLMNCFRARRECICYGMHRGIVGCGGTFAEASEMDMDPRRDTHCHLRLMSIAKRVDAGYEGVAKVVVLLNRFQTNMSHSKIQSRRCTVHGILESSGGTFLTPAQQVVQSAHLPAEVRPDASGAWSASRTSPSTETPSFDIKHRRIFGSVWRPKATMTNSSRKVDDTFLNSAVAQDLLAALECCGITRSGDTDDAASLCDVHLLGAGGHAVPACRFVLAARSPVFSRMLYGPFREAKSSSIALLGYEVAILRAVVYFCSYHQLDPTFPTTFDAMALQLQLIQAADYLQLPALATLVSESMVLRHMALQPERVVGTVFEQAPLASDLCAVALQMIEARPYITLDPHGSFLRCWNPSSDKKKENAFDTGDDDDLEGGVTVLSAEKLELVLKSPSLGASEYFLLQQLSRWYHSQLRKLLLQDEEDTQEDRLLLTATAKALCQRYIPLSHIEPSHLLSPTLLSRDCPFLSSTQVFEAISQQALRASKQKIWHLPCRGAALNTTSGASGMKESLPDRVLVEGSGSRDVDGIYYALTNATNSTSLGGVNHPFLRSSPFSNGTKNILYTKREVVVGQQYVYTLSRCLRDRRRDTSPSSETGGIDDLEPSPQDRDAYYECRIFCCPFLTQGAVRHLQLMQATASLVPCYQPVLQVVLTPPAMSDDVPTPIRKYYRVRLSDGAWHMPATLAPELNALVERNEIDVNRALRILEFGVYTIYGCAAIHVLKAATIHGTAKPLHMFGNPQPLEDAPPLEVVATAGTPVHGVTSSANGPGAVQHLYRAKVEEAAVWSSGGIPKAGWSVDAQGLAPAPECTWLPGAPTIASSSGGSQKKSARSASRGRDARSVASAPVVRSRVAEVPPPSWRSMSPGPDEGIGVAVLPVTTTRDVSEDTTIGTVVSMEEDHDAFTRASGARTPQLALI